MGKSLGRVECPTCFRNVWKLKDPRLFACRRKGATNYYVSCPMKLLPLTSEDVADANRIITEVVSDIGAALGAVRGLGARK